MHCVRLCLVFNPLSTVFSVQVGCVYDKLGGSSSDRHIVVSLSKTESVHIQKNITFSKKAVCRYNSGFLIWP